jgi:hypothetical protein
MKAWAAAWEVKSCVVALAWMAKTSSMLALVAGSSYVWGFFAFTMSRWSPHILVSSARSPASVISSGSWPLYCDRRDAGVGVIAGARFRRRPQSQSRDLAPLKFE